MCLSRFFEDPVSYVSGWQGGWDQIALTRYVWQWSKRYDTLPFYSMQRSKFMSENPNDRFAMSHDSYTCRKFPDTTAFPTKRESGVGNYVGSVVRDITKRTLWHPISNQLQAVRPLPTVVQLGR